MSIAAAVPLSGWILPEDEIRASSRREGQRAEVDPMVDGRHVVELRRAIGVRDRDVERPARVHVGGEDRAPGKAVDGGEERRPHVGGEGERQPVQVVVNEVEVARAGQSVETWSASQIRPSIEGSSA
jgi:hypothetical protein